MRRNFIHVKNSPYFTDVILQFLPSESLAEEYLRYLKYYSNGTENLGLFRTRSVCYSERSALALGKICRNDKTNSWTV